MLITVTVLALIISYWAEILPISLTTPPLLLTLVVLMIVAMGNITITVWSQRVRKTIPHIQSPGNQNSTGNITPRVQPYPTVIPMASILLGCMWAFQQTTDSSVKLHLWIVESLKWLAITPMPIGVCVFLGFIGIIWYIRNAAINARGHTRRMPGLKWIVIIALVIAALCEIASRTWFEHPVAIVIAILAGALTLARVTDLWYSKTETFLLLATAFGVVLASRNILIGIVWTPVLWIVGYRVGDLIGWLRLAHPGWSSVLEGIRWLVIMSLLAWIAITPTTVENLAQSHFFLIIAVALPFSFYGPMHLLPAYRPRIKDKSAETEFLRELKIARKKAMRVSSSKAANLLTLAKEKLRRARSANSNTTDLGRTSLADLDGAQWISSREEWPGILNKESAVLDAWLGIEHLNKEEKWIEIQHLGEDSLRNEARLRLMVYTFCFSNFAHDDTQTNQVNTVYHLLRSKGDNIQVLTRWFLWRAFFSRCPDAVEEFIQQKKLLADLEAVEPFDLLAAFPPTLWMGYESDAFQLLRIAEHSAWRAVVTAGRLGRSDEARSLFCHCSESWKEIRHTLMLTELNPLALINIITRRQLPDQEKISRALARAEPRRPALRRAQGWVVYAELLEALAVELLLKQMKLIAVELNESIRDRIAKGFSLPKTEVKKNNVD